MIKKIITLTMAILMIAFNISQATYYVNTDSLNVRSWEWLWKSGIKTVLYRWEQVTVIQDAAKWWKKIQLKDGSTGFVNWKYLMDKAPELKFFSNEWKNWNKVKVNVYSAFVRLDTQKKPIAIVRLNEELQVIWEYYPKKWWIKIKIINPDSKYYWKEWYIWQKLVDAIEFSNTNNQNNTDNLYYTWNSKNTNQIFWNSDKTTSSNNITANKVKYKIINKNLDIINNNNNTSSNSDIIDIESVNEIFGNWWISNNIEDSDMISSPQNVEIFDDEGDLDLEALFSDL